ncbi:hypothetical protein Taro_038068 [Colocasia esculenta]|uniref:Bifunctional inhibitor/plant lipid transfer protein/seed storage helical domain-containing protein n=1 Tax=Colocasia esculenta TaxID=4460 RepID=A0A843WI39_COLES|nr:hypothetical protein [Colocasia esculenta]
MVARTGLLLLSVLLVVAFHSGAGAEGPSRAPVAAPRPSTTVMAPMAPTPSSTETPLAPVPAPASNDCMNTIFENLLACLTYVEDGSNMTRPEKGCCQGLSTVVNTNPVCLCSLLSSTNNYGIAINRTKSLMLPTICRVQTPPVSLCAVIAGGPASSPAGSPSGAATMGPTLPAEPSASPPAGSSADPRFVSSVLVLLAGLALATFAMF